MRIPVLESTGTSIATTYHLRPVAADIAHAGFGWALCTINDATGELQIMSDWGEWSHRWHADPKSLGAPTLSHFIANRAYGFTYNGKFYPDTYLADKLTSSDDGKRKRRQFSPEATVKALRTQIVDARRTCTRGKFTREVAREIWDELGAIESEDNEQEFHRRLFDIDDPSGQIISGDVYEEFQYEDTLGYRVLVDAIVPTLAKAARERLARDDWYARAMSCYAAEVA